MNSRKFFLHHTAVSIFSAEEYVVQEQIPISFISVGIARDT